MQTCTEWADNIASALESDVRGPPNEFFDSFEYTNTGHNLTHPLALGILTRLLWHAPGVQFVGVDVRLNSGNGVKLQPDLVAYDSDLKPLVLLDYESPNSSDARVPWKDVDPYVEWRKLSGNDVPYLIVTTLPDCRSVWQLRYASGSGYNAEFQGRLPEICKSPFHFWYEYYQSEFRNRCMDGVAVLNIDRQQVRRMYPV